MTDDRERIGRSGEPINDTLFDRYLAGECAAGEQQIVERWLAADPADARTVTTIHAQTARARPTTPELNSAAVMLRIRDRAAHRPPSTKVRWNWYLAAASVMCLMIGVVWSANHFSMISATGAFTSVRDTSSMLTYVTTNGQRATIVLSDGSTVLLNVASRLRIPANYSAGNRVVQLSGAALFNVAHHDSRPFVVTAGPSTTRVLGTSFVVRYYRTDTAATIAVRDGKVAVGNAVLTSMRQIVVGAHASGPIRAADAAQFDFASGTLTLHGMTLKDAIPELSRWYDADVRLAGPELATRRITFEGAAGSVSDLTSLLELIFDDIGVVRRGRVLTLYKR